ncbi:MAG: hypothetical protein ACTSWY_13250 [Promethearchaeota archaeon]
MIYLEETLNLLPASPENLTKFVEFAQEMLVPACERLGTRVVAWSTNVEWYAQVTQIMEFENMDALKKFRINSSQDKKWGEYLAELEGFAPERHSRLLEPLGPVSPNILSEKIIESQKTPKDEYFLAILQVNAGKMDEFKAGLEESHKILPIIACFRPIIGNPNEVIDLWEGAIPLKYKPSDDTDKMFFGPLRQMAPKERVIPICMLPYSQLL